MVGALRHKAMTLAGCMMLCTATTMAQDKVTADVGAELVSGYIWRGQDLGNISLQGYFHYKAHNTAHVFEANVGYDFGFLSVNWYTNFAGNDGVNRDGDRAYSSYLALAAPFHLGGIDWTAEVGAVPWATSFYNATDDDPAGAGGFEVANVSIGAAKSLRITDRYALPLFARVTWNPATEGAYFVFGLRLF